MKLTQFSMILVAALSLMFAGCGKKDESKDKKETPAAKKDPAKKDPAAKKPDAKKPDAKKPAAAAGDIKADIAKATTFAEAATKAAATAGGDCTKMVAAITPVADANAGVLKFMLSPDGMAKAEKDDPEGVKKMKAAMDAMEKATDVCDKDPKMKELAKKLM